MTYKAKIISNYFIESNQHNFFQGKVIFQEKEIICYLKKSCDNSQKIVKIVNQLSATNDFVLCFKKCNFIQDQKTEIILIENIVQFEFELTDNV